MFDMLCLVRSIERKYGQIDWQKFTSTSKEDKRDIVIEIYRFIGEIPVKIRISQYSVVQIRTILIDPFLNCLG